MKNRRLLLPGLALVALVALGVTGCFITSAQVLVNYPLPNPFTIAGADGYERIDVDLNTIQAYKDHKAKLKNIADFALIGKFTNESGPGGGVEVWISAGSTTFASPAAIRAGATKLWGPGTIGAFGTAGAVRTIGWNDSAALFTAAGRTILLTEAKGDGAFTLYTIGTPAAVNTIRVEKGFLILVIGAGI
jgi:hypothetical protein